MIRRLVLSVAGACLLLFATETLATSEYRIGAEDVLSISVWDNKELDQVVFVRPDGKISLPLVGEVQAGGLTVAELVGVLTERYSHTVKSAQVVVGVREIRSRPVFFVGGVAKAGPIQLTRDLTLLQAISVAGGPAVGADIESAFILRGEKIVPVDLLQLMQHRALQYNLTLEPGDTIVVPLADVVYVQGEVRAPGVVKFVKDLTVVRAITQAGGLTPLAAPKRVTVIRRNGTKGETLRVNVAEMMHNPEEAPDLPLKPNDIVIVAQRLF